MCKILFWIFSVNKVLRVKKKLTSQYLILINMSVFYHSETFRLFSVILSFRFSHKTIRVSVPSAQFVFHLKIRPKQANRALNRGSVKWKIREKGNDRTQLRREKYLTTSHIILYSQWAVELVQVSHKPILKRHFHRRKRKK